MDPTVKVALISGAFTLAGIILSLITSLITTSIQHNKTSETTRLEIEHLKDAVNKHNQVIERTLILERKMDVAMERISVADHRIEKLEEKPN